MEGLTPVSLLNPSRSDADAWEHSWRPLWEFRDATATSAAAAR
jgi:hypothetical protein